MFPTGQTLDAPVCGAAALGLQLALPALLHEWFCPLCTIRKLCRWKSYLNGAGLPLPWTFKFTWSGQRGPPISVGCGLWPSRTESVPRGVPSALSLLGDARRGSPCACLNRTVHKFVARSLAHAKDELVEPWEHYNLIYAFLPLHLLPHLLSRIEAEWIPVIPVALDWACHLWYADVV